MSLINNPQRPHYRYSEAFKLKVVDEIEKGKLAIRQASQIYEINGGVKKTVMIFVETGHAPSERNTTGSNKIKVHADSHPLLTVLSNRFLATSL